MVMEGYLSLTAGDYPSWGWAPKSETAAGGRRHPDEAAEAKPRERMQTAAPAPARRPHLARMSRPVPKMAPGIAPDWPPNSIPSYVIFSNASLEDMCIRASGNLGRISAGFRRRLKKSWTLRFLFHGGNFRLSPGENRPEKCRSPLRRPAEKLTNPFIVLSEALNRTSRAAENR